MEAHTWNPTIPEAYTEFQEARATEQEDPVSKQLQYI